MEEEPGGSVHVCCTSSVSSPCARTCILCVDKFNLVMQVLKQIGEGNQTSQWFKKHKVRSAPVLE